MSQTKRRAPSRPLACHKCGAPEDRLIFDGGTQYVQRGGHRRRAAHVRCDNDGWEWKSVHPRALLLSDTKDEEAVQARYDGQTDYRGGDGDAPAA